MLGVPDFFQRSSAGLGGGDFIDRAEPDVGSAELAGDADEERPFTRPADLEKKGSQVAVENKEPAPSSGLFRESPVNRALVEGVVDAHVRISCVLLGGRIVSKERQRPLGQEIRWAPG